MGSVCRISMFLLRLSFESLIREVMTFYVFDFANRTWRPGELELLVIYCWSCSDSFLAYKSRLYIALIFLLKALNSFSLSWTKVIFLILLCVRSQSLYRRSNSANGSYLEPRWLSFCDRSTFLSKRVYSLSISGLKFSITLRRMSSLTVSFSEKLSLAIPFKFL